ncbi:hypothetical protein SOVF_123010, partial [Spinacia oleracea]
MITRALHRLRSPITTSFIHHLNGVSHLSSSAAIDPAAQPHRNSAAASDADTPKSARPSTITWEPRLHNSASFIGTVEFPLKQYATQDEHLGVYTSLRVKTSPHSDTSFCISLEMWGALAERALLHLKQKDYIYVSGELGSYTKATSDGKESLKYKVTAKELNYVKLDESGKHSDHQQKEREAPGKNSPRVLDSEKESGEHLGESGLQMKNNRFHLWQILFANPNEWYDNRKNKRNPKQPDFKNKSTGEALWFNESDPSWVKKQIELLDSRLSGSSNYDMTSKLYPSRFVTDELLMVPNPMVAVRELDDAKPDEPERNFQTVVNSGQKTAELLDETSLQKKNNRLLLWQTFFANPDEWYDNRKNKKNPKQPDFKHKSSGEALWLSERGPEWINKKIEELDCRVSGRAKEKETSKSSQTKWVSEEMLKE